MNPVRRCGDRFGVLAVLLMVLSIAVVTFEWRARSLAAQKQRNPAGAQAYLGVDFRDDQPGQAPVISEVVADSPAAKAGLKKGDILIRIGKTSVQDTRTTVEALHKLKPDEQVLIKIKRNDKEMEMKVVIGARPIEEEPSFEPQVAIQAEDYARIRKQFRTKLLREGPAPQKEAMPEPPAGVSLVEFPSGELRLKGWMSRPPGEANKRAAVLFLHGGFGFGIDDWKMAQPYRDAGYVVFMPILRGENGQEGKFTLFYNEVDDILAAAEYLGRQPFVDSTRLFVAGHSVGGTLALLSAQASSCFRAAASFSGSPDQVLYCKYGFPRNKVPFEMADPREFQVRSPLAYAGSFKCPVRLYYATNEKHFYATSKRTAAIAKDKGLNAEAIRVEGGHETAVPAEMKQSITFFAGT
jgi:dienelactone hydrolase